MGDSPDPWSYMRPPLTFRAAVFRSGHGLKASPRAHLVRSAPDSCAGWRSRGRTRCGRWTYNLHPSTPPGDLILTADPHAGLARPRWKSTSIPHYVNAYCVTAASSQVSPSPGPRAETIPSTGNSRSVRTAPAISRYSNQDAVGDTDITCALASTNV
jgi:hypothetical protein